MAPAAARELPVAEHVVNADAFPDELPDLPDEESLDLLPPPSESTEQAQMGQPDPRGVKRPWYTDAAGAPEAKRLGSLLLLGGFVTIAGLNSTMEEPTRLKSRQLADVDSNSPFAAALLAILEEPHVLGLVRVRCSRTRGYACSLTYFATMRRHEQSSSQASCTHVPSSARQSLRSWRCSSAPLCR